MATTTKKLGKKEAAKRSRIVKTSLTKKVPTDATLRHELAESLQRENAAAIQIAGLLNELVAHKRQLTEALEHQTATSEVLGIISRSPTDVQPVLDAIVESAARLCSADDAIVW